MKVKIVSDTSSDCGKKGEVVSQRKVGDIEMFRVRVDGKVKTFSEKEVEICLDYHGKEST